MLSLQQFPFGCELAAKIFFGDHLAVEQMHFAVGKFSESGIVRDHADGGAVFVQFLQPVGDGFARCGK